MAEPDLVHDLATVAGDLSPALAPASPRVRLDAVCRVARVAFGAAAVSVAAVVEDVVRYVAADGAGADLVVGTELPVSRGLAGYCAASGQALAIDQVERDPRFDRDTAERTGYVPTSMLVVPAIDAEGEVLGVLTVLDRAAGGADALQLATSIADQVAMELAHANQTTAARDVLVAAFVDAIGTGDVSLAAALHRRATAAPADDHLAHLASVLSEMRRFDPATRAQLRELIDHAIGLARLARRR